MIIITAYKPRCPRGALSLCLFRLLCRLPPKADSLREKSRTTDDWVRTLAFCEQNAKAHPNHPDP